MWTILTLLLIVRRHSRITGKSREALGFLFVSLLQHDEEIPKSHFTSLWQSDKVFNFTCFLFKCIQKQLTETDLTVEAFA